MQSQMMVIHRLFALTTDPHWEVIGDMAVIDDVTMAWEVIEDEKIGNEDVEDECSTECGTVCSSFPCSPCTLTGCSIQQGSESTTPMNASTDASTECSIAFHTESFLAMRDLDEQVGFAKQDFLKMMGPFSNCGRDQLLARWCDLEKDIFVHNQVVDQFIENKACIRANVEELKSALVMIPTAVRVLEDTASNVALEVCAPKPVPTRHRKKKKKKP